MPGFKCDCLDVMGAKLAEHNTKISVTMAFPRDGTPGYVLPKIDTEKIETRVRKGPVLALPGFCSFCGIAAGAEARNAIDAADDQMADAVLLGIYYDGDRAVLEEMPDEGAWLAQLRRDYPEHVDAARAVVRRMRAIGRPASLPTG